jgi:thiol-disulfide isomerase/thioredoxin
MKSLLLLILLVTITSCSYRSLVGKTKPAYFTADNEMFTDTLFPEQYIIYDNLHGIKRGRMESAELLPGNETKILINGPTLVKRQSDEALVYPDEHILIEGDYDDYTFSTLDKNPQRDRELKVFKVFRQLEKSPGLRPLPEYNLETVLKLEQEQRDKILKAEARSQQVFDSLLDVYQVSDQFRKLTKNYIRNKYDVTLAGLYELYSDTLKAHGLYKEKYRQLLPYFNNISDKEKFNSNVRSYLNYVHTWLFQGDLIWSFPDEEEFKKCFDNIENNFRGLARDYLLTGLMWRAYARGFKIPASYTKKYKRYSINKEYRKVVKRTKHERKRNDRDKKGIKNELLMADGKTTITLEGLLAQFRGKYVLIDFWASWCVPCIREMPHLKQLEEKYSNDKIAFIGISLDKQTESWHRRMRTEGIETSNNYLLLNANKTSFCKKYDVNEIPRYMLVDPNGKVINDNTPLPSNPELVVLIDSLLHSGQ